MACMAELWLAEASSTAVIIIIIVILIILIVIIITVVITRPKNKLDHLIHKLQLTSWRPNITL